MKYGLARVMIVSFAVMSMAGLSAIARADMVPNNTVDAPPPDIGGPRTQELAGLKLFYIYTGEAYGDVSLSDAPEPLPSKPPS